jgi:Aspartyl protease
MRWLLLVSSAALFVQASNGYAKQIPSPQDDGSSSQIVAGAHTSKENRNPLDQLVADHNWPALESAIGTGTGPETAFYRGLLLNRRGQYEQSLQVLQPLMPELTSGTDRRREKEARLTLGNDYFRTFRYRQAAEQFAALSKCCAASLTQSERDEAELPSKILPFVENSRPQTLELSGAFTVPAPPNALGVREIEVFVDGYPSRWLLDPAANFTMLSRSQAKRIGLKLTGDNMLTVRGIMGEAIKVQAAVIPQLKFGAAFFHNVPAMIYEDSDFYDKPHQYQIEGVLAQPLLAALGAFTVSDDGHFSVLSQPPLTGGVPFFSDGLLLLAAVGAKSEQRLYAINPGSRDRC